MNTNKIASTVVLVISLVLIVSACVIAFRGVPSVSSFFEKLLGTEETSDTVDTDEVENPPSDSSSETESSDDALQEDVLSLDDLDFCYIYSEYGDYRLGLVTEQLEANTQYRISWVIDNAVTTETVCFFAQNDFDGEVLPYVLLDTSYTPGEKVGKMYALDDGSLPLQNSIVFTTENQGDSVVFFPLAFSAADGEQAKAIVNSAKPFFTEVTISKIGVD